MDNMNNMDSTTVFGIALMFLALLFTLPFVCFIIGEYRHDKFMREWNRKL